MARKYDADSIVVLEDDRSKLRTNPSMYIPDIYKNGAIHIIFEVVDNSIDELAVKEAVGSHIDVTFDKTTKEVSIADDGSGVPLEKLFDVLTKLAASGKFNNGEDSAYLTSAGRWGHGLKTATYLSKSFQFTSMRDGKSLTYTFEDGTKIGEKKAKSSKHGTYCKFTIDPTIVDTKDVTAKDIKSRLEEKSYLYPNIHLTLTVLDDGKESKVYKYGGKDILDRLEQWKPDTPAIRVTENRKVTYLKNITDDSLTTETVTIDIAFAFKEEVLDSEAKDEYIISYANGAKTYSGGTHNDGLKLGIQRYFKEVAIPKLKGKDKDLPIMPSDMIAGLCAFVTVRVVSPIYMGQEKSQFSNQEVKGAVRDAVFDALNGEKSSTVNQMVDFVKRVTKGRMASKKTRKKNVQNAFSKDRPEKYQGIVENLQTVAPELLLVEGEELPLSALPN